MEKINIILIENDSQGKDELYNLLSDDVFKIYRIDVAGNNDILKDIPFPKIMIYRIPNQTPEKNIADTLNLVNPGKKIPVLFITSPNTAESYLDHLESGISNHINTPFKKEFLYSKIFSIINKYLNTNEGKCSFDIEYNIKRKKINTSNEDFVSFLVSALEYSIHQKNLLHDSLKKDGCFDSGDIELIDKKKYALEYNIRKAMDNNEFILYYQPVISLPDNTFYGFEALIRWKHPERGIVPPDEFIDVIEKSPLVIPIGYIIIEKAVKQLKKWQDHFKLPVKMSINLSAKQFVHDGLCEKITDIIDETGIAHEHVAFEITERAFVEDMEAANIMLLKLRAQKFRLYMDDFGTGYSSLTYLLHFPVDAIKIDKSFIEWINIDETSEHIVKSVIFLAHNLNMKIIAEGVETKEHLDKLIDFFTDYGQGYYFAKPLNRNAAEEFIKSHILNKHENKIDAS